jgi:tetratricopeptide (TPR) repeat protein
MVLKVQGDHYMARGQRSKASELYKKAFELDPTDKEAETKFAESLIVGADLGTFVPSAFESQATGKSATILSALLPGLGQIVTGQTQKGIAFLVIYMVSVGALFAIPNGIKSIAGIFSSRSSDFNGLILIPLLGAAITWFISFADAQSYAKRFSTKKVVERPVPPVDKDFEI